MEEKDTNTSQNKLNLGYFFKGFFGERLRPFFQKAFWKDKLNLGILIASLLVNILVWILLYIFIEATEYPIPLHYNIYFGIDLTGSYQNIYNLPLIALFIIIINFILTFWFYHKNRIISYILTLNSFVIQIFILIGAITVILINQ